MIGHGFTTGSDSVDIALGILLVLVMAGVAAFLGWDNDRMSRMTIEGALLRYHVTDIRLKLDWMDSDRDNFTYDVEYTDTSGKRHYNRCKVNTRSDDGSVYWDSPLFPRAK